MGIEGDVMGMGKEENSQVTLLDYIWAGLVGIHWGIEWLLLPNDKPGRKSGLDMAFEDGFYHGRA